MLAVTSGDAEVAELADAQDLGTVLGTFRRTSQKITGQRTSPA